MRKPRIVRGFLIEVPDVVPPPLRCMDRVDVADTTFGPPMNVPLLFNISGGELLIVLLFVLLFFGSKGIPDVARTMGRLMRQVRDASQEVQREIHKGANEVRREVEEQRRAIQDRPATKEEPPPAQPGGGTDPPVP